MDLMPTPEQAELVAMVRHFVRQHVVPLESDLPPDAGSLPPEIAAPLRTKVEQMGLTNWDAPQDVGGPGLDVTTKVLVAMEMSQHRAGLYAPCYGVFGGAGLAALYDATDDQKRRYLHPTLAGERCGFFALTEPTGGSDPARAVRTRAERDGDDWLLTGTKLWISGVNEADYGVVVARTGPGREGLTSFIVDKDAPGLTVARTIPTLRRVQEPTELHFDRVRVPDRNRLGDVGSGFSGASARLVAQRLPYAANCVGVAIAAHRLAVEWAANRETFGKVLAEQQGIQWMLVDNETDIETARLLILRAASMADHGQEVKAAAALAKLHATEAASRVVDRSMQIHGAMGMAVEMPFERWYREMRIRRVGEGPNEVQRLVVARQLLGQAAAAPAKR